MSDLPVEQISRISSKACPLATGRSGSDVESRGTIKLAVETMNVLFTFLCLLNVNLILHSTDS